MRYTAWLLALAMSPAPAWSAPGGVSDGLRIWLRADQGISAADGGEVLLWTDASGNGNDAIFNPPLRCCGAPNVYEEYPPVYDLKNPGANGQPTVRFNGESALEVDLSDLSGADGYTIFVVNARDRGGLANFYIGGELTFTNSNLILGYEDTDLIRFSHFASDLDGTVEPYAGVPDWSIDTFRFFRETREVWYLLQEYSREIYRDGRLVSTGNPYGPLGSTLGSTLGHTRALGNLSWFTGDIAEVIAYDRALSDAEQWAVESELAARYGRPLNSRAVASNWTDIAPTIDGLASETDWHYAGVFPINRGADKIGALRFMNDHEKLYVLIDLVYDTVDDSSGDFFDLLVDTNRNELIDEEGDLWYSGSPGSELWRAELYGVIPYAFLKCYSDCPPLLSELGSETFGTSPGSNVEHRIFELSLDLDEIQAASGEHVRIGIWLESGEPDFFYMFPPETFHDFERLIEVYLAVPPPPPNAPPQVVATKGSFIDRVAVSWSDVENESTYEIYRCADSSEGSCGLALATLVQDLSIYADTGAGADGTLHYYRVKACNSSGCSPFSPAGTGFRAVAKSLNRELGNISTRAAVGPGANAVVAGFVIDGSTEKCVVIRGRGPSVNINGQKLADPTLELKQATNSATLDFNDDWWRDHPAGSIVAQLGKAPGSPLEAAIYRCLAPGAYTAYLRGYPDTDLGIGIVEVIDADEETAYLLNISTRARVIKGARRAVAGFVISGDQPRQVLIRGRGPTVNVNRPLLTDPALDLREPDNPTPLATNDDWGEAPNVAEIIATGRAPVNDQEAAILITLQPGNYTVTLESANDEPGIGIVEVIDQSRN